MAEGHPHQHPPPVHPPPPPSQVRPGFPPPLGRPPPPPPPPLTHPPPRPPPPRFQAPPPNQPPSPPRETVRKKTDASEQERQSDSSRDALVKNTPEGRTSDGVSLPVQQTLKAAIKESKSDTGVGSKVKISLGSSGSGLLGKRPAGSITMKLKPQMDTGSSKKLKSEVSSLKKPSSNLVAKAFGSDSEEEEEMPPEARLRMRNIGKDTPTSAGPNSFNKSVKGFSDPRGSWRNELDD